MPRRNIFSRLANSVVPGHTVPAMLAVLYAIPAGFGVYAFRDRYAVLVALGLTLSIGFYYIGYFGAGRIRWIANGERVLSSAMLTPKFWKRAVVGSLISYVAVVTYLAVTAKHVALFVALGFGDTSLIASARDEFVQNRVGWEALLRYLNAILFRVVVPCIVVSLYLQRYRWRYALLVASLFCALLTLEKSLTLFILVPLAVALLIDNRTHTLKVLGLAAVLVLVATTLAGGFLELFAGRESGGRETLLVSDLQGDRKNLFWVIETPPGAKLQEEIARYRPNSSGTPDGILQPLQEAGSGQVSKGIADDGREPPLTAGITQRRNETSQEWSQDVTRPGTQSSHVQYDVRPARTAISGDTVRSVSPKEWESLGLRNRIVNGAMEIERSGGGTDEANNANDGRPRRWIAVMSVPGKIAQQTVSDVPKGFDRAVQLSTLSAWQPKFGEVFELEQRIEGYKVKDFDLGSDTARSMTLSFWVKASIAGRYNATIVNGLWTRSYLATYPISRPNTWEHKVLIIPGDKTGQASTWPQDAERSLVVSFNLGAGRPYQISTVNRWQNGFFRQSPDTVALVTHPSAAIEFTGVQLELGTSGTPFESRPPALEARLVRHYIPPTYLQKVAVAVTRFAPRAFREEIAKVLDAEQTTQVLRDVGRQTKFMVNRVAWIPYVTAYDWMHFQHDVLHDRYLDGKSIGLVAWLLSGKRYPVENEIFRYQYGFDATRTGTANAVYFADAYLNFGLIGVIVYSLAIGVLFRLIATCRNAAIFGVSVMSAFGLMVASFPANMLSGGLSLIVLLALLLRDGRLTGGGGAQQATNAGSGAWDARHFAETSVTTHARGRFR